jgi:type I restriction enzyme M protein
MVEQDTRIIIDNNLINKGWILDINNPRKNVYFERSILSVIDNPKLRKSKKSPDYVLVDNNKRPIGIIEAKAGGKNLEKALDQATEYAEILQAPLIFVMNNSYCQTKHLISGKPLFINESEVNELIRQKEAIKFLHENTNEIYTIPKEIIISRKQLIEIFQRMNESLRAEGLRSGIERLSEFANILFLKLYTENKADNVWENLKKTDNDLLVHTFKNSLNVIEKQYGASSVFSEPQIKNPETLKDVIMRLDQLMLSTIKSDIKGDAFEYFLRKATANKENDLGEYFTPRHIVRVIVNLVNPKFKETIYDPFCGTGGFLTESFNFIRENNIIRTKKEKERLTNNTLFGREITTNARLSKMNMILHGDGHNGIEQINSLKNPVNEKFDIVMTNIPFSQIITNKRWNEKKKKYEDHSSISPLYYNGLGKNDGDSVCILHCFKSVKKDGRFAAIVPEGFLFDKKQRPVREYLLENSKLQSIISLPQGVFLPYTNTKTSILYFIECHTGKTRDKIWYFDVKNDGFSLDNNREPVRDNDLKKLSFADLIENEDRNKLDIGFTFIPCSELKKNNYILVKSKYKVIEYNSSYPLYKLADIVSLLRGPFGSSVKKSVCVQSGYKLYEQGNVINNDFSLGNYYIDEERFGQLSKFEILEDDVLVTCAGTIGKVAIVPENFEKGIINSVLMRFRIYDKKTIFPEFLRIILESKYIQEEMLEKSLGTSIKNMRPGKELKELMIPLPPLEEQKNILYKLKKELEIIDQYKSFIKNSEEKIATNITSLWGY